MANPPKRWKVEYARSLRSLCKTCNYTIDEKKLRLGKIVQATKYDGRIPMWNHIDCMLKKVNQIKSLDDVEGIELLRWEDQQKIGKYVEGGGPQNNLVPAVIECGVEVSQTSSSTCRRCNQKITKREVCIFTKPNGRSSKRLAWHHASCFMELSPTTQVEKLSGWDRLSASDQAAVRALVKAPSTTKGRKIELQEDKEFLQQSTSKGGAKRKRAEMSASKLRHEKTNASELESQREAQNKELWALKDDLEEYVTTAELKKMLKANGQDSKGSPFDLRDRCADGMLFGALARCPRCRGCLYFPGGMYQCNGDFSKWSVCTYYTTEPERVKGKWKIPEETSNQYLCKWFKLQKAKKPVRILRQPSSITSGCRENLGDLKVAIAGVPKESIEEWKRKIEGAGGQVHAKIKKGDTNCLVVSGNPDDQCAEMRKARRMKLPIVIMDYLSDCIESQEKLPFDQYKIESIGEFSSMGNVKEKGQSAVHESSRLQNSGHILEDGKSIYNVTMNKSDLSTSENSYYMLQIIQDDKGSDCHLIRKWGRVGNEKNGGKIVQKMSKSNAIQEFKHLFLKHSGNSWEACEQEQHFEKKPRKFFVLDTVMDYGVNRDVDKKNVNDDANSQLAPPLVELMKMLFNEETYSAAMMEFKINMKKMPLGKLSKSNIQQGFEALTEIQSILNSNIHDPTVKEIRIVDASNRFFTVIPSTHPNVIRDLDHLKSKVNMLEALQDIEIASSLLGFGVENDGSLYENYKKLRCDVAPLPHESEDYQLIEKYLQTTHELTHTHWDLELEEVFSLEREGEFDKYAPYQDKLKNKMLLWHGSRLTNFVSILSRGLRIAPPQAPATGYHFGKGIYFADLVSNSAEYCHSNSKKPLGLMLLNEVALGEIYELNKAKYMEKAPEGWNSTKGLGQKMPQESEYVKWKDEVVVPCGKPVSSNVKESDRTYNEYIVYNTAQVKMQFLLKVRFHHKKGGATGFRKGKEKKTNDSED